MKCRQCNSDLVESKTPGGNPMYLCNDKFCSFYGKHAEVDKNNDVQD
ncbi:hypothetical protein [Nitrosopumilus sp.]